MPHAGRFSLWAAAELPVPGARPSLTTRRRRLRVQISRFVGRQLSRTGPDTLRKIRTLASEELIRALVAGAEMSTVQPMIELAGECDRRLEHLTDRRLEADETSVERRQRIAGEALELAPDAMGPRRARRSDARTHVRSVAPKSARAA